MKGKSRAMEILLSEIQFIFVKPQNGLVAFTSFVINNTFFVADVALYSLLNREGYRLSYPIKILKSGLKINCFHPINKQIAESIEKQVIEAYLKLVEKAKNMKGSSRNAPEQQVTSESSGLC
jgi:stage V sporulation protein G